MQTEKSIKELENEREQANNLAPVLLLVQQKAKAPALEKRLKIEQFTPNTVFYEMLKYYDSVIASPFEFIVNNLVVISSGIIGKWRYIDLGRKKLFFNLYSIIIGNSTSSKKTTSITSMLKDIENLEASVRIKNEQKQQAIEASDTKKSHYANRNRNEYITYPAIISEASFFEAMANNSRGLQWHSEFKTFTSNLEKSYNGGFKSQLVDIYDCNRIVSATKSGGEIAVNEPFLSLLGATTIEWLNYNGIQQDISTGFLNRFLFCRIYNNTKEYVPLLEMKPKSNSVYPYDCSSVFERLYNLSIGDTEQKEIEFAASAKAMFVDYDLKLYNEAMRTNNDTIASFYGRLNVSVAKIAGIIALINNHDYITESDVKDAIILGDFYKFNIQDILSSGISNTKLGTDINKVIAQFKSGKQHITVTDLTKMFKNDNRKHRDDIIENLLQMDKIEYIEFKTPNAKKPTKAYRYIGD